MKNKYRTLLSFCLTTSITCGLSVTAHAGEISAHDIGEARVTTLTTTATEGFLNIANGRNCLTENSQGKPALETCQKYTKENIKPSVITFIELAGKCLTDTGTSDLSLTTCDYQNNKQQWKALLSGGTDVRNVASNMCLTASGIDIPVRMAKCSGGPEQNWKLPK